MSAARLRAVLQSGANVLVSGPAEALEAFGAECGRELRQPVACTSGRALEPKAVTTLVIVDVHLLDDADQRRLSTWLAQPETAFTQVVSLSPTSLFSLVQAGKFDPTLYYRLNTIFLQLEPTKH